MEVRLLAKYTAEIIAGAALPCLLAVGYVSNATHAYIYSAVDAVPQTQTAMVLGASIGGNGTLSQVLQERADRAVELYRGGKVSKILVSGDDATVSYNEVDPVGRYLMAQGIPEADIFLDHAGFDTYSSMYRARDVFGVTSLTIVSQPFHLPRAVFIARTLGLTAFGVSAGKGELFLFNDLREVPATIKAVLDLALRRTPKYLGQQFFIGGDGSRTWVSTSTAAQYQLIDKLH